MTYCPRLSVLRAFSLIELLAVISVLLVLFSILIPVTHMAQQSALRVQSQTRFAQWMSAVEAFRLEYGYYPFASAQGDTLFEINGSSENRLSFEQTLAGQDAQTNRRGIVFHRLSADEIDPISGHIVDAFGNSDLVLLIDTTGDGWVRVGEISFRGRIGVLARENRDSGFPRLTTWHETAEGGNR